MKLGNLSRLLQVLAILLAGVITSYMISPKLRFVPLLMSLGLIAITILKSRSRGIGTTRCEVNEDLIYLITHMYAVSTGRPPNKKLFSLDTWAGGYGDYDSILKRIAVLAVDWGYGFARAIRFVALRLRNRVFRDFLLRLGEVLSIGEEPAKFLDIERRALLTEFQAHYFRVLEASKLLLGVYTSCVSSAIFIVITFMIYIFLFPIPPNFIVVMYVAIAMSLSTLLYILYRVLPRDRVTHNLKVKIPEKVRYRSLLMISLGLSVILGVIVNSILKNTYLALSIASTALLIPGLYARRIEKRIREIDSFFSIFIRSFGLTYSTIPHTPTALESTLRSDYGPLTKYLRRLLARLKVGVDPKVAWYYFIGETWSEVVRRNVNILVDSINTGADLAKVGTVLSETTFRILDIKKQRTQLSKAFESTIYVVHTLFIAIMSFVMSLLTIFSNIIGKLQTIGELASVIPFRYVSLDVVFNTTPFFVITLSVINALVIKIAQGGMYETLWVPLAMLLMLSGLVMFGVNLISNTIFSSLAGITGVMSITSR